MKQSTLAALCLSVIAVAGCTSTPSSVQLASSGSWEQLGQMDGLKGLMERTDDELSELSSLQGNNAELYHKGYTAGITEFCTLDSSFFQGFSGFQYQGQCARFAHEDEYIESWKDGRVQFDNNEWDKNSYAAEYETETALQ